jgi:hypothetical membrane protein
MARETMDSRTPRQVAGVSLVGMGLVTLLGFVTAASLYPGYSVADQTISAMGAADAPAASSTVFNAAMVVAGLLTLVSAVALYRATGRRLLTVVVAVTGVGGFVGVGLFPSQTGLPHFVAALIAFVGAGVSALLVAAGVGGLLRYLSASLGVLELLALVLFVSIGPENPLGIGGLERWVAYLGLLWAIAFGGALLAGDPFQG